MALYTFYIIDPLELISIPPVSSSWRAAGHGISVLDFACSRAVSRAVPSRFQRGIELPDLIGTSDSNTLARCQPKLFFFFSVPFQNCSLVASSVISGLPSLHCTALHCFVAEQDSASPSVSRLITTQLQVRLQCDHERSALVCNCYLKFTADSRVTVPESQFRFAFSAVLEKTERFLTQSGRAGTWLSHTLLWHFETCEMLFNLSTSYRRL